MREAAVGRVFDTRILAPTARACPRPKVKSARAIATRC